MSFLGTISSGADSFCRRVVHFIDGLNYWIGHGVAWATLGLVLLVCTDVFMRYVLSMSFVFTQELEWHIFAFIFLMGAGCTLLYDGHVRVDIFYQRLGPKGKAWVNLLGVIFLLIPGCYLVIDTSVPWVYNAYLIMEGSPDPGGIACRFVIKSTVPAGFTLLLLQGISLGIKSLYTLLGKELGEEYTG